MNKKNAYWSLLYELNLYRDQHGMSLLSDAPEDQERRHDAEPQDVAMDVVQDDMPADMYTSDQDMVDFDLDLENALANPDQFIY